jgi:hypothetical protein
VTGDSLVVALPVFVTVQASIIFAQYASLLGFPPFMDIVWPPDLLAEEVTTWLGLDRPYPGTHAAFSLIYLLFNL